VTHYVPVNDKPGDPSKLESVPQLARDRQPRHFARTWIDAETVYLVWPDVCVPEATLAFLEALCAKVTRIGHSMSFVQMWVARPDEIGSINWVLSEDRAELYLRVAGPGTLEDLERRYNADAIEQYAGLLMAAADEDDRHRQRKAKKQLKEQFPHGAPQRLRPQITLYRGYARPVSAPAESPAMAQTVFSPHFVIYSLERRSGPFVALGLPATLAVTDRWREALVSRTNDVPDRVREIVSGHDRAGNPLQKPHLALIPLAFVGHSHADGHILGLAAVLPAAVEPQERRGVLQVLARVNELKLGPLGVWSLVREMRDAPPWNLRSQPWTAHPAGSTCWATVTPVAFDRHPKSKDPEAYHREAEETVAASCTAIGLPRPRRVVLMAVSPHLGVPPAPRFPRLLRKDGGERRHLHALLLFDQAVRGPVLLGAGRYLGYGLCRPLSNMDGLR
jgi:CRISPR-associated protein Csb2